MVDIGNSLIKTAVMDGGEAIDVRRYEALDPGAVKAIVGEYPSLERAIVASTGQSTAHAWRSCRRWRWRRGSPGGGCWSRLRDGLPGLRDCGFWNGHNDRFGRGRSLSRR